MHRKYDEPDEIRDPYILYFGSVVFVSVLTTVFLVVVDSLYIHQTYSGSFIIETLFLLFTAAVFFYRKKLNGKLKEIILIAVCFYTVILFLFCPAREEHLKENPALCCFVRIVIIINFLVIGVGGVIQSYSNKKKLIEVNSLTGLGNSIWMTEYVNERIESGVLYGTLLLVDVRNFRIINSIFGRKFGDKVILLLAEILKPIIDEYHVVAHFGGIEFCIWVECDDEELIRKGLGELDAVLRKKINELGENVNIFIKTSGAVYPDNGKTFNELLRRANIAMEQTIINEQLSHVFYKAEMERDLKTESIYIYELQKAVDNNDFYICYQEKYNLDGDSVFGLEALARWNSEVFGKVSPSVFIPLIHKAGLTSDFTEIIIKKILNDFPDIEQIYGSHVQVSINIPPSFFMSYGFVDFLKEELLKSGATPERITLEITEDIFIDRISDVVKVIKELQSIGFRISLDDFGTGYSSLSYLQKLPIQELKIDKSFIKNIDENEKNFVLVKAICEIAHSNNYMIVAEGVETEKQLHLLKETSCDLIQGFIYSRPAELDCCAASVK